LFSVRAAEEIDGEHADEGFEGVAEAGLDGDRVVKDGVDREGPEEEPGGGDSVAQG